MVFVEVGIEYCSSCGYRAKAVDVQRALETAFGTDVSVQIAGGRSTSFELSHEDTMLHSKLETGKFVSPEQAVELVRPIVEEARSGAAGGGSAAAPAPEAKAEVQMVPTTAGAGAGAGAGTGAGADAQSDEVALSVLSPKSIVASTGADGDMPKEALRPLFLRGPLFWFPFNVNRNGARVIGLLNVVWCIIGAIWAQEWWGRTLIAAQFADYAARFVLGPNVSVAGSLGGIIAYFFPIRITPGPPKQFAQLVGSMMTGAATLALYVDLRDDTNVHIARALIATLAFFAFLEGGLDFCAGCWMFKIATKLFHIEDPSLLSDAIAEEQEFGMNYARQRITKNDPQPHPLVRFPKVLRIPARYKPKSIDFKKEDVSYVRHMHVSYFSMPMSLGAFALALQVANRGGAFALVTKKTWVGFAYFTAVVLGLMTLLYLAKAVKHFRKVRKEWDHPVHVNFFAAWTLCFVLLASLSAEDEKTLSETLFWIGGPAQLVLSVIVVARWVTRSHPASTVQPSWMVAPVGNIVAAFVMVQINAEYIEAAYIWYATGLFMWFTLFAMTLFQLAVARVVAPSQRAGVAIFVACPAAATLGNRVLQQETREYGHVSLLFFGFTIFTFFAFVVAPFMRAWSGRPKFNMSYWAFGFPFAATAVVCIDFMNSFDTEDGWPLFLAYATLILASMCIGLLTFHTVRGIITRQGVFVPNEDLSAVSYVSLMHFAFRNSLKKLGRLAKRAAASDEHLPEFVEAFGQYAAAYYAHAEIEDRLLFPAINTHFPGLTSVADAQHHRDEADMASMLSMLLALCPQHPLPGGVPAVKAAANTSPAAVSELMDTIAQNHNDHFDLEETHISPIAIKTFNSQLAVKLGRRAWKQVAPEQWRVVLPFVTANIDTHPRRAKFFNSMLMAVPEHAQLIGRMVYEGLPTARVGTVIWRMLSVSNPALIPRGLELHSKLV